VRWSASDGYIVRLEAGRNRYVRLSDMPIEYTLLKDKPIPLKDCPYCGEPFEPFLRGQVQSALRRFFKRPYCALICWECKAVVGYEKP
jgi:hypothetical protein